MTLRRGREIIEVLTYSGRRVCLILQGRTVCFELLATADGRMILAGENFVWRTNDRQLIAGYEVQAEPAFT